MPQGEDATRYQMERETLRELGELQTDVAVLKREVGDLRAMIAVLVTRPEFKPIQMLVYGMAGSLLAGVVAALLAQVMHK